MSVEEFAEVFDFLHSDREDVRKMAVQGIAQQSKDNTALFAFLSSPAHGPRAIDALLQFFHVGGISLLGDILTIFINCSAEGGCSEMLVARKVVRRTMRLLDALDTTTTSSSFSSSLLARGLAEMALMLLSNLTASHITAVDDLLQMADEDLRGFYLGKLQGYYDRLERDCAAETCGDDKNCGEHEEKMKAKRDLRKWILQILLNLTRSSDGQRLLMEDEDWRRSLTDCLAVHNRQHRFLAAQCYRNCSIQKERHAAMFKGGCLRQCVRRLCDGSECQPEVEMMLAEIVAAMMRSEEGMGFLEEMNAKRHFQLAIAEKKLHDKTAEFVLQCVLPFLDDVVDAYVMPGSDDVE